MVNTRTTLFLPHGRQHVDENDIAAVAAALRGDWLTGGPAVSAFGTALAPRRPGSGP